MKRIALIFAAGRGVRLSPLTDTTPKPLLVVGNLTLLEWNMRNIVDYVDKIVIVIGYLGDQIQSKFGTLYKGKPIEYVWQQNPKGGTLDAFRAAVFDGNPDNTQANYIILHADDIHGQTTYTGLFEAIQKNPDNAYLSGKIVHNRERLKSFGVFRVDENNVFLEVVEKPQEYVSNLANIAVSYFPNKVLQFIPQDANSSDKERYITDLFNEFKQHYPIYVVPTTDRWIAITSVQDLEDARREITSND